MTTASPTRSPTEPVMPAAASPDSPSREYARTRLNWVAATASSAALAVAAWQGWLPLDLTEVFGFGTGAVCVWLAVRRNLWTFPVGIANNALLALLFLDRALYADMSLQFVYIGLGLHGWHAWLRGYAGSALRVSHASRRTLLVLAVLVAGATWGMVPILEVVHGKAPFWDALTTALSLAAQYLLNRKHLESWYIWVAVDVIYIPLYWLTDLPLTALLYALFLGLCLLGWRVWRRDLAAGTDDAAAVAA